MIYILIILVTIIEIIIYSKYKYKMHNCNFEETVGYVVDYNKEILRENYVERVRYAPIVEYEVDGKKYRYVEKKRNAVIKPKNGKKIKIMYNVENPVNSIKNIILL